MDDAGLCGLATSSDQDIKYTPSTNTTSTRNITKDFSRYLACDFQRKQHINYSINYSGVETGTHEEVVDSLFGIFLSQENLINETDKFRYSVAIQEIDMEATEEEKEIDEIQGDVGHRWPAGVGSEKL